MRLFAEFGLRPLGVWPSPPFDFQLFDHDLLGEFPAAIM